MAQPGTPSGARSRWADLGGPVHWLDFGGPSAGPLLVGVHGLGGAAVNWAAVAPLLTRHCRLVAPDLAGFGLTRSLGRRATIGANRLLLHRFLTEVAAEPAVLVGNSMGGMLSAYQAVAEPRTVRAAVLVGPALPPPLRALPAPVVAALFTLYAIPLLGPFAVSRARRMRSPAQSVQDTFWLCCADPSRIPADIVELHVQLATRRRRFPEAEHDLVSASRSILLELARRRRYAQVLAGIPHPVLLLHGSEDRFVRPRAARRAAVANPGWQAEVVDGVGHVPMLETPEWTATTVLSWLRTLPGIGVGGPAAPRETTAGA